jgi:hypothetical protein
VDDRSGQAARVVDLEAVRVTTFYAHNTFGSRGTRRRQVEVEGSWLDGVRLMIWAIGLIALVVAVSVTMTAAAYFTLLVLTHQFGGL